MSSPRATFPQSPRWLLHAIFKGAARIFSIRQQRTELKILQAVETDSMLGCTGESISNAWRKSIFLNIEPKTLPRCNEVKDEESSFDKYNIVINEMAIRL